MTVTVLLNGGQGAQGEVSLGPGVGDGASGDLRDPGVNEAVLTGREDDGVGGALGEREDCNGWEGDDKGRGGG